MDMMVAEPARQAASPSLLRRRAIATLSISQMIGWGTTLYVPSIMGSEMRPALGLSNEVIFGGISLMLVAGALASTRIGAAHDRYGAWRVMTAGSLVMTLALVVLAFSQGLVSYTLAWCLIGIAMPMSLSTGAYNAIAQIDASGARRVITILTFFTGVTSSVFWPLTAWLQHAVGWRETCLLFAAAHGLVCLPLHLFALPRRAFAGAFPPDAADTNEYGSVAPKDRAVSELLLMIAFSCQSFVSWGLLVHIFDMLREFGLPGSLAVTIASFRGPCQVLARFVDMVFGSRYPAMRTGAIAVALQSVAVLPLLVTPAGSVVAAVCFTVIFGLSDGLMTVVRPAIPLGLYGRHGYGAVVGRLSRPQNLVSAVAPIVFAAMLARLGIGPALWLSLAVSLAALAGMLALLRLLPAKPAGH